MKDFVGNKIKVGDFILIGTGEKFCRCIVRSITATHVEVILTKKVGHICSNSLNTDDLVYLNEVYSVTNETSESKIILISELDVGNTQKFQDLERALKVCLEKGWIKL